METLEKKILHIQELRNDDPVQAEKLSEIYERSNSYSLKYVAGMKMDIDVDSQLARWTDELEKGLNATKEAVGPGGKPIKVADINRRLSSLKDSAVFWRQLDLPMFEYLIKHCYESNDSREVRLEAGKILGIPEPESFFDRHYYIANLCAIAAGAAIGTGVGMIIHHYASR